MIVEIHLALADLLIRVVIDVQTLKLNGISWCYGAQCVYGGVCIL